MITEGKNGFLLPSKDVRALAEAMIKIREDAAARREFGALNADLVHQEFTIEGMCKHYEALFLNLYQQEMAP